MCYIVVGCQLARSSLQRSHLPIRPNLRFDTQFDRIEPKGVIYVKPEIVSDVSTLLDPQVISALVVSGFSASTAFFSWLVNRGRSKDRKQHRTAQLVNLYEPLDYLLSFPSSSQPDKILSDVQQLVKQQYRYLTPGIQNELKRLLIHTPSNIDGFADLREMVSSVYNWLRRSLGYPYSKQLINYRYLPKPVSTLYSFWDFICWIASAISVILGVTAILFVFSLIPKQIYETLALLLLILLLTLTLYLLMLIAMHVPKKIKKK